jgi:hypothetical protein
VLFVRLVIVTVCQHAKHLKLGSPAPISVWCFLQTWMLSSPHPQLVVAVWRPRLRQVWI